MVLGDKDCCAKRTCGHGEIWHPTCCLRNHAFIRPLVVEGRVLLIGDKFWYNFPGDEDFPKEPKGWIECIFSGVDGNCLVIKPRRLEKFVVGRNDLQRFKLLEVA